jgi:AcrR family transcriptional regulator
MKHRSRELSEIKPKWNRRKEARPAEIIEAAMDVFVEKGFAAARLDDVAKRAGIVKGTLYRYFDTKEDVFRAVARHAIATNLDAIEQAASAFGGSLAELVPALLIRMADHLSDSRVPAIVRMVVADSRTFPDLARIWHDEVVTKVLAFLTGLIAQAQARNEVRPGDPKLYAFSIIGPMVTALLFHEVFGEFSASPPKLSDLAAQHAQAVLRGMLVTPL